jgi:hypothetical protein
MFLRATHLTRYTYSQPVSFAPHALYLRPRETPRQRLHNFTLTLTPAAKIVSTGDASERSIANSQSVTSFASAWSSPTPPTSEPSAFADVARTSAEHTKRKHEIN